MDEKLRNALIEALECDGDLLAETISCINSWNGAFQEEEWYDMDCFDEMLYDKKPSEVAEMIRGTDFDYSNNYFRFDVYGNLESSYNRDYSGLEEDVVDSLESVPYSYLPMEIREIIDEYKDEEENEKE